MNLGVFSYRISALYGPLNDESELPVMRQDAPCQERREIGVGWRPGSHHRVAAARVERQFTSINGVAL